MRVSRRIVLRNGLMLTFTVPVLMRPRPVEAARRGYARHPGRPRVLPLVVLDPGHGGKDPGCIGADGTQEKRIALDLGLKLRRLLLADRSCRVAMTRETDTFIPLEGRVAIAERQHAALFISIHENSCATPSVAGASVYTLAAHASDPDSAALAARENSADRFAGPRFRQYAPDVARILRSLVRHETRVHSAELQQAVLHGLGQDAALLPDPARHADFAVLKASNIPSVLVEMGFLSNRHEEALLKTAAYRMQLARSVKTAIDAYLSSGAKEGWVAT